MDGAWRWRRSLLFLALMGGLGEAGCREPVESPDAHPALLVGVSSDIMAPSPLALGGLGASVVDLVFRPLFRQAEGGEFSGDLVESWSWSSDGSLLQCKLRDGIHFSDGSALSAADVVDSYRRSKALGIWGFDEIAAIETPDPRAVTIHPARPFMMPVSLVVGVAKKGSDPPIGAGPYLVETVTPERLRLTVNSHFDGVAPSIAAIEFRRFADASEEWSNLLARKVDVVTFVPWNKFELLSDIPTIRSQISLSFVLVEISLRNPPPPFDRPAARRALALAIDRDELVRDGLRGQGLAASGIVWPRSPLFDEKIEPYAFAPAEARAALIAAGCTSREDGTLLFHGAPLRLDVDYWSGPDIEALALLAERQLSQMGIDAHFHGREIAEFRARVLGTGPAALMRYRHAAGDVLFDDEARTLPPQPARDLSSAAAVLAAGRATQRRLRDEPPSIYLVWLNRLDVIDRRFCGMPSLPDGPEGHLDRVHPCAPGEDR